MKVKIVEVTEDNFDLIPRPANRGFNCQECFYWVEKRDGRTNLTRQKKNWFAKRALKHDGSLGKLLFWGVKEVPVGFAQFGPISEFKTTRLIYEDRFPVPKGGWCISCVAVQTPYRSKGLATRLIRNILRDLKRRGVKSVDAYPARKVNSWNQVSHGPKELWEKCGFKQVGEVKLVKGIPALCGEEMLLMRKTW